MLFYGARYYASDLGRFIQADTIVPDPFNPQSLNRYTYTNNNPIRYIDPTGHDGWDIRNAINEFAFGAVSQVMINQLWFAPQATRAVAATADEPVLRTVGRAVGDVVSIAISGLEGGGGSVSIGGGIAACGTGVLCAAGAPALAVGAAVEAQAVASGLNAAGNLGTNISMAAKKATGDPPNPNLIGARGTQMPNTKYWEARRGDTNFRLEVENPKPGYRDGQIHFQEQVGERKYTWIYDIRQKVFRPAKGTDIEIPNYLKELLEEDDRFNRALEKALKALGEE